MFESTGTEKGSQQCKPRSDCSLSFYCELRDPGFGAYTIFGYDLNHFYLGVPIQ